MSKVRATLILYKELGMSKLDEEGLMDQMEEFPWLDKSCALSRVLAELQIFSWVMVRRRLDNYVGGVGLADQAGLGRWN